MGQSPSRQAPASSAQEGRTRRTSGAKIISRHSRASDVPNRSWNTYGGAKSPVQHHDYDLAPARVYHQARTPDIKAHSRPARPSEDTVKSKSKDLNISKLRQHNGQKDTPNISNTNRRERHQARVRQAKDETKAQSKTDKQSSSLSNRRVHRHTRPKQTKECIVCTDTRSLHRFPTRPPTTQCTHEANVCRRCLRKWIQSESGTKIWNEVRNMSIHPLPRHHL